MRQRNRDRQIDREREIKREMRKRKERERENYVRLRIFIKYYLNIFCSTRPLRIRTRKAAGIG